MGFKSQHLLAPEYADISILPPVLTAEYVAGHIAEIQGERLKIADNDPIQPDKHWIAPERNNQQAVDLYAFYPQSSEKSALPLIYFMHGGGYTLGNPRQQNGLLKNLAEQNQALVVSVGYTLASTKPHPADLNDALHGLLYLFHHADDYGIHPNKIIVMGESAGAGLAARLALKIRDTEALHLCGQVLIYPMLDYRTGTEQSPYLTDYTGEFVWTAERNRLGWSLLRGGQNFSDEELGYFSPTFAQDFRHLPPTFMTVGALDLFVHENIHYAQQLILAGVPTEFHLIVGVYHGFEHILPHSPQTQQYIQLRNQAISKMFAN